jgi:putative protease
MEAPRHHKVELLAPAGNVEKLHIALHYGADAVYLAGKAFSLRNFSENFTLDEISAAVRTSKDYGAKVYVAVNAYARREDLEPIGRYLSHLNDIGPQGVIVADPAVLSIAQRKAPRIPIHLSTQANTTNAEAARFWRNHGVQRINVARELSLSEIARMAAPQQVEIEAFVHGAMCISYSGRCLLSNYMANRPSNQGQCCQPCRFNYAVVEETRPGQYFSISEDERGTYLFNSRDLCMLNHLPDMIEAGISALKIEGRMKSIHYTATVVNAYRCALDIYYADPGRFRLERRWREELDKIASRGYCTGFYFGAIEKAGLSDRAPQRPTHTLAGKVLASAGNNKAHIEVRNQIRTGDTLEILTPGALPRQDSITRMIDAQGQVVDVANPGSRVTIHISSQCRRMDILRRLEDDAQLGRAETRH